MKTVAFIFLLACSAQAVPFTLTWDASPPEYQVDHWTMYELVGGEWAAIASLVYAPTLTLDRQPGRYTFAVTASNIWGESDRSNEASTPAGVPSAPGGLRIGVMNVQLMESPDMAKWTPVYSYVVTARRAFYRVQFAEN